MGLTRLCLVIVVPLLLVAGSTKGQRSRLDSRYRAKPVQSEFTTAKSKVSLSCDSGKIVVKLNFAESFRGVVQAGPRPSKDCSIRGDGRRTYTLTVPLDGCGTCVGHSCSPGTFVNTLMVRYHPTLELDGDDVKTVICKYQAGSIHAG